PELPTSEDHRKTNRLRQYERHPALAFLSGASPVQRSAGTTTLTAPPFPAAPGGHSQPRISGSSVGTALGRHYIVERKLLTVAARVHTRCMRGTERRPLGRALSGVECPSFSLISNAAADPCCQAAGLAVTPT